MHVQEEKKLEEKGQGFIEPTYVSEGEKKEEKRLLGLGLNLCTCVKEKEIRRKKEDRG